MLSIEMMEIWKGKEKINCGIKDRNDPLFNLWYTFPKHTKYQLYFK